LKRHRQYWEWIGKDGFIMTVGGLINQFLKGVASKLYQSSAHPLWRFDRESIPSAAQFRSSVADLLRKGLDVRDRFQRQEISEDGLAIATRTH
jgi:hypothetical protein